MTGDMVSVNLNTKEATVYFIDEKKIKTIVNKTNPLGRIGDVDIPLLEKKISALPAVDSANVYMNLNGTLNLDILQRIPVFRLNFKDKDVYVDKKGVEFPISKAYSHPAMLVTGDIAPSEYPKLIKLVNKINEDSFCKKYFIGISKTNRSYNLLTGEGNYKVEIGDLDNIDFKVKGFKTFVEKYLIYQEPEKYSKISVRYDNQIVTTLNPNFKGNDSILNIGKKELTKSIPVPIPNQENKKKEETLKTQIKKEQTEKKTK